MSTLAQKRMTVDEFLAWAEGREGRWELHNGVPCKTSPDTVGHGEVKMAVYLALRRAARTAGQPSHILGSGIGVRISDLVMYVPDASVYCGQELPDDAMEGDRGGGGGDVRGGVGKSGELALLARQEIRSIACQLVQRI